MKIRIGWVILLLVIIVTGCASKRGIIELHTRPFGADVYVDDVRQGASPLEFEYDFTKSATLKIEKHGYAHMIEALDEAWILQEVRKGNYREGDFTVQGETVRAWKVTTTRILEKK